MYLLLALGVLTFQAGASVAGNSTAGNGTMSTPGAITAHPDGNCMQPLSPGGTNSLPATAQFPSFNVTTQPSFPGAEAKDGGGYDVWWRFADPPAGCRTVLMQPYAQARGTPGYAPGKEIINVGRGGCYFGSVPSATDLYAMSCCGAACTNVSLNSTSLLAAPTKRSVNLFNRPRRSAAKHDNDHATPAASPDDASGSSTSLAKRYFYPTPSPAPGCNFAAGQPFSQAGQQVIVTPTQFCSTQPCTIAVQNQVSFSTTATSSKSQTLTNSVGVSTSITAGVNFLSEASVTTTFSYDFSSAIQKATGMDVMQGNSTAITNTLSLKLGNAGAVSFTPVYKCWTGTFDCGKGVSDPIDVCQPDLSGANGSLKGEYDAVIYNG